MGERIEVYEKYDERPSYVECGTKKNFTITFPTDFVRVIYIARGGNFRRKSFEAVVYLVGETPTIITPNVTTAPNVTGKKLL